MLLDFVQHIIKSSALMFANPACQPADYPDTTQSCTGNSCFVSSATVSAHLLILTSSSSSFSRADFSKWVAVRLLRLAAAPDCDVLHSQVSSVLRSLLHTLRARSPSIGCHLTGDLILLAQELSIVLHNHVATLAGSGLGSGACSQWPVTLECFSVPMHRAPSYLTPCPLTLPSPASLESLAAVTISILSDNLRGVVSGQGVDVAWETGCSFLAVGNVRLRRLSMLVLRRLVELQGFPEKQSHEFFAAYLHLLETTCKNASEGDPFRGELLSLTRCVFQPCDAVAYQTRFEAICLSRTFECVCTLGRTLSLQLAPEVTQSLCVLFHYLLSAAAVYEGAPSLREQRVAEVCKTLASTIGTEHQAQVKLSPRFNNISVTLQF